MDIEIFSGSTKAIISTSGGYVTNLADERGDILFPKRTLTAPEGSEKTRGGCHVCSPNFGPGGESGLAQHGYGRTSEWKVVEQSETQVTLLLMGEKQYETLESHLVYQIADMSFEMSLQLKNTGDAPLAVAPGFHPYFSYRGALPIVNNAPTTDLSHFLDTVFIDGNEQSLTVAGRNLTLRSDQLTKWAVWTDQLGGYLCVEPTQLGNAFVYDTSPPLLEPGQEKTYTFTMHWA